MGGRSADLLKSIFFLSLAMLHSLHRIVRFLGRRRVVLGLDRDAVAHGLQDRFQLDEVEDARHRAQDGRVDDGRGLGAELVLDGDLGGVDGGDPEALAQELEFLGLAVAVDG